MAANGFATRGRISADFLLGCEGWALSGLQCVAKIRNSLALTFKGLLEGNIHSGERLY